MAWLLPYQMHSATLSAGTPSWYNMVNHLAAGLTVIDFPPYNDQWYAEASDLSAAGWNKKHMRMTYDTDYLTGMRVDMEIKIPAGNLFFYPEGSRDVNVLLYNGATTAVPWLLDPQDVAEAIWSERATLVPDSTITVWARDISIQWMTSLWVMSWQEASQVDPGSGSHGGLVLPSASEWGIEIHVLLPPQNPFLASPPE